MKKSSSGITLQAFDVLRTQAQVLQDAAVASCTKWSSYLSHYTTITQPLESTITRALCLSTSMDHLFLSMTSGALMEAAMMCCPIYAVGKKQSGIRAPQDTDRPTKYF